MRIKSVLSWLVSIAVLVGLAVGVSNLQEITDWLKLRNYQPDSSIARLADETTMKTKTRDVFYINHPQLDGKTEFNKACTSSEQTIVLGCYHSGQNGIFIYNVQDSRLTGILEVTAAHETLHALYERLNSKDKKYVNGLLEDYYQKGLTSQRVKDEIKQYQKTEPDAVVDEMHSIFGTEVASLPAPLEEYYKRYFNDRSKIVGYSDSYEQAFLDIENKAKQYDSTLSSLKSQIDTNEAKINSQLAALNGKQSELDSLRAQNDIEGYNSQVPVYNSMVKDYNALVNETKQEIDEYNNLLHKRNELVLQQQQLYQEINSNSINSKGTR